MRGTHLRPLLLVLLSPALSLSSPLFTLTAPNILHAGNSETIVIHAHDYSDKPITVDIQVFDFPKKSRVLHTSTITLHKSEFLSTATIQINPDHISEDTEQKQFVYLQAKSNLFVLEKIILLSSFTGYLFTQTDKTIYTPGQNVNYRVFVVNRKLDPLSMKITIDIQNPGNITVHSETMMVEEGILPRIYKIPDLVSLGTWKIITKYQDAPQKTYLTEFEVKEYVLPSIDVTLESSKKFFHINEDELEITIRATYIYKKPVDGRALVVFGVKRDMNRINIEKAFQRVDILDGKGKANLTKKVLSATFGPLSGLIDAEIIVDVTVFTSGGDMAQAEKSGIKIVKSPYEISFIRTPMYFKPLMELQFWVLVTNPDGSPAPGVNAASGGETRTTNKEGVASFRVTAKSNQQQLTITVRTKHPALADDQQAQATMTAKAYQPHGTSANYLHLEIDQSDTEVGNTVKVTVIPKTENKIKYYTYMLLNKGRIVKVSRMTKVEGQSFTTFLIDVTADLLPSFRIVVYYFVTTGSQKEIVADSTQINVKKTCMGTLKLSATIESDKMRTYQPQDEFKLDVKGDAGAKVGLVAVDKAVFALNNKYKFSQKKIWDVIDKSDLGCTPGGGSNSMGVFSDAGLAFATNADIETTTRQELHCPKPVKQQRQRRSLKALESKRQKVNDYTDPEEKECCEGGMHENPMGHSCEQRVKHVTLSEKCAAAFFNCCKHAEKLTEEEREELILARSGEECEGCSEASMEIRSYFPESFMWTIITIPTSGTPGLATINNMLPDSITTWEVLAVSLAKDKGICVSEPYELTVMKPFFIDLKLPYSAQRNEQVEIKAILYNYGTREITVTIMFPYNDRLCSYSRARKNYQQVVKVPGTSSKGVSFVVVPLSLGIIDIEVYAVVRELLTRDGIRKPLQVVPEGITKRIMRSVPLEPKGRSQKEVIEYKYFEGLVPDTDPQTFISIQGDILGETLINSLDSSDFGNLIRIPTGCVEQNMLGMATNVILTHYMDKTNQWDNIGVESRKKAIENIATGYTRQLTYIEGDKSFKPYRGSRSGTWLTAYIAKIFAMAYSAINIEMDVVCGSVKWLILNKQKPDGVFVEDAPVYTRAMQGGFPGSEQHASLTAFVLIALKEAEPICSSRVQSLLGSIKSAKQYLEQQLDGLRRTYTVAIASYALALADSPKADSVLERFISSDKTHWPVEGKSNTLYTAEATAYALLHAMKQKKYDRAHAIASWLVTKRAYGGGLVSTQATVIGLQALAQYMMGMPAREATNLKVVVDVSGRSKQDVYIITDQNSYLARSNQFPATKKITVTASGTGQGTLTVMTVYNSFLKNEQTCKYKLRTNVTKSDKIPRSEEIKQSFKLEICTSYNDTRDATMTIIDISLLTGFFADEKDLKQLKNGIDKYINNYETKATTNNGSVIIYLDKVPHDEESCFGFKIHQQFDVGLIQPASITIYEYYDPGNHCTMFYHLSKKSGLLDKICQGDVCRCAEENCFVQKTDQGSIDFNERLNRACDFGKDFAYVAKLNNHERTQSYDYYNMTILKVIKEGSDDNPLDKTRRFVSHMQCFSESHGFILEKQYLIMGEYSDLWQGKTEMTYVLSKNTWIEWWPIDEECQDSVNSQLCQQLQEFVEFFHTFGCPT